MTTFLAPFFIAFGIGAGLAVVLTVLAAVAVVAREGLLLALGIAKELASWPRHFWEATRQGVAAGLEDDRRRRAGPKK
jgi:hypothetical protein